MGTLNNQSGYIQLSNDRSHLIEEVIVRQHLTEKPLLDIYDIVLIVGNLIIICYLVFNFLKHKKSGEASNLKQINLMVSDKNSGEFPFFQTFKKKPRNPATKKAQLKEQVPHITQNQNANLTHNIVELKCTKCNYTTQIYQKNILNVV